MKELSSRTEKLLGTVIVRSSPQFSQQLTSGDARKPYDKTTVHANSRKLFPVLNISKMLESLKSFKTYKHQKEAKKKKLSSSLSLGSFEEIIT